jgi:hypothetical protein
LKAGWESQNEALWPHQQSGEERTRWEKELAEAEVGNFHFNH